MNPFPRPFIPLLQGTDTIDLGELDGVLETYIKYPGIALGDWVYPVWRGCGADGQAHDLVEPAVEVSEDNGYSEANGLPVSIPRELLLALDQGWLLYSYSVAPQGGAIAPESLRQFCHVGVRTPPVAQMRDAHDLVLDPDNVTGSFALAVVPPYGAMRPGDKVILTFIGYWEGEEEDRWTQDKPVTRADIGKPLAWQVPKGNVSFIEGGYAEVLYHIEYVSGERSLDSPVQIFQIGPETSPRQPAPWVDGHEGEDNLDPGVFPDGLYLHVPAWPGMSDGDWLLLHWVGGRPDGSVIKSVRMDASLVDTGVVEIWIEPEWLLANVGGDVRVFHQFARAGRSLSSETLSLGIRQPLDLLPPVVDKATAEGGSGENKGVLDAALAVSGVYVDVPSGVPLGPDDLLEVHWAGHPAGGQHVATTPANADNPRRFRVPSTAVAANIGGEAKRFDVFYRLSPGGGAPQKSVPFHLRIEPFPVDRYPNVECLQANTELSLSKVPESGADLRLRNWYYMAEGQLLIIEARGVNDQNQQRDLIVRDAAPVTADEFAAREITAKLSKEYLASLQLGQSFLLEARVSYDGGETWIEFRDTNLKLIA